MDEYRNEWKNEMNEGLNKGEGINKGRVSELIQVGMKEGMT